MRRPQSPPSYADLSKILSRKDALNRALAGAMGRELPKKYLHWDTFRHTAVPKDTSHEEQWLSMKFQRMAAAKATPLQDKAGQPFTYCVPDMVAEQLHGIDVSAGGIIGMPKQITNPQTRHQYVVRSLMEEAITSSQLEGAVTTRKIAKEMIRTGRPPKDRSERMILNNYATMQKIVDIREQPLTQQLVFGVHKLVTVGTLDDDSGAGRFRSDEERITVQDESGEIFHDPPASAELQKRMESMCQFANAESPGRFVHPVLRAIILHFWLAYDHPFVDGNGRTARALFYWSMLQHHYWLFEFISISEILVRAPAKYARSFLDTETDDNDLTYFIIYQLDVIRRAVKALHIYIEQKAKELRQTEMLLRHSRLNHRQEALVGHALRHPDTRYTIEGHRVSHNVVYDTARNDLLGLHQLGYLEMRKAGKALIFFATRDLVEKISSAGD